MAASRINPIQPERAAETKAGALERFVRIFYSLLCSWNAIYLGLEERLKKENSEFNTVQDALHEANAELEDRRR